MSLCDELIKWRWPWSIFPVEVCPQPVPTSLYQSFQYQLYKRELCSSGSSAGSARSLKVADQMQMDPGADPVPSLAWQCLLQPALEKELCYTEPKGADPFWPIGLIQFVCGSLWGGAVQPEMNWNICFKPLQGMLTGLALVIGIEMLWGGESF